MLVQALLERADVSDALALGCRHGSFEAAEQSRLTSRGRTPKT